MKKIEKTAICFMVIFALALLTACSTGNGNTGSTAESSTLQPTTGSSTSGPATGPTNGLEGTNATDRGMTESGGSMESNGSMESTGVIDGLADDLKKGVDDIESGVDHAMDHSGAAESSVGD